MRSRVNAFLCCAWMLLPAALPEPSRGAGPEQTTAQEGENLWVPSLAITSGVLLQKQEGFAQSELFEDGSPDPVALQPRCNTATNPSCMPLPTTGSDIATAPFVGAVLELMSPALPVPTRPRFFANGEILPTFASKRALVLEGEPNCIRSPVPDSPCVTDLTELPNRGFLEEGANGQGIRTNAKIETLTFGASLGAAFPFQVRERQLRIKPSFGWITYEVEASGLVVNAACDEQNLKSCVTFQTGPGQPVRPGFLREPESLSGKSSQRFHGIGPGLDIEVDTGRFGPIGTSLFLGGRAYHVLGDRKISIEVTQDYDDPVGMDTAVARWEAELNPWIFRAHVGLRFQWLGTRH